MRTGPKILLCTPFRHHRNDYYDFFESFDPAPFRPSFFRRISYGLRFLKQNIPELEILEYPTWEEYLAKLGQGWDVVGFSFYLNDTAEILQMAEAARKRGVKELWAGNYGALTDKIEKYFDRIFIGPAEKSLSKILGHSLDRIRHPPLLHILRLGPIWLNYRLFGILITSRGCSGRCSFCQTPSFCPRPERIPLESIQEVLDYYKAINCHHIYILDESFGTFADHSDRVYELLAQYGFYSTVNIRADYLLKHLDRWVKQGFESGLIGVESLFQTNLDSVNKRETVECIEEAVRRMHEHNCYVIGNYMIGFEDDTVESIRAGIKRLLNLKIDFNGVSILLPLPRTPLWTEIEEKYGIFEKDWHKYDAKHLVWNHPHISSKEMEGLLSWSHRFLNRPKRYFSGIYRLINRYKNEKGNLGIWRYLLSAPLHAQLFNDADKRHRRFL